MFPQISQITIDDFKLFNKSVVLGMSLSLFFKRWRTIRLADLGPKPGNLAKRSIRSIKEDI